MILTEIEQLLTPDELFYEWLIEGKVSFQEISRAYVSYLEYKSKQKDVLISGLAIPLSHFVDVGNKSREQKRFHTQKASYNLIKLGMFKGTPFEKKLKKMAGDYEEDEYGFSLVKDKKVNSLLKK